MGNPTDPDAGTNRTNAVSRDNLMEETRLGYTGAYNNNTLNTVGKLTYQQSSTLRSNATGYVLDLRKDEEAIHPQDSNYKRLGLPVRCATQSEPVALIMATRLNQACIIHTQAVTIGATNYTR